MAVRGWLYSSTVVPMRGWLYSGTVAVRGWLYIGTVVAVRGWWMETRPGLSLSQKWVTDAKSLGSQTQNTARTPKKYRVITPKKYGVMHRFSYH